MFQAETDAASFCSYKATHSLPESQRFALHSFEIALKWKDTTKDVSQSILAL